VHHRADVRVFERIAHSIGRKYPEQLVFFVADGRGDQSCDLFELVDLGRLPKNRFGRVLMGWLRALSILKFKPRVVHFHDPELLPLAPVWRLFGIKAIYDVHEELRKQVLGKPWVSPALRKMLAFVVRFWEKFFVMFASGVCTATPSISQCFSQNKTVVVQNFPSTREQLYSPGSERLSSNTIFYVGSITKRRSLFELLDALSLVSQSLPVKLILAGPFVPKALRKQAEAHEAWSCVDYIEWADRSVVAESMAKSIAGIVLCHPEKNYMEAQPTKLFEYMWGGLPVIASDFPYWKSLLEGCDGVEFADPESPQKIAEAIEKILRNPNQYAGLGEGLSCLLYTSPSPRD